MPVPVLVPVLVPVPVPVLRVIVRSGQRSAHEPDDPSCETEQDEERHNDSNRGSSRVICIHLTTTPLDTSRLPGTASHPG